MIILACLRNRRPPNSKLFIILPYWNKFIYLSFEFLLYFFATSIDLFFPSNGVPSTKCFVVLNVNKSWCSKAIIKKMIPFDLLFSSNRVPSAKCFLVFHVKRSWCSKPIIKKIILLQTCNYKLLDWFRNKGFLLKSPKEQLNVDFSSLMKKLELLFWNIILYPTTVINQKTQCRWKILNVGFLWTFFLIGILYHRTTPNSMLSLLARKIICHG